MTLDDLVAGEQREQGRRIYRLVRAVVLVYLLVAGALCGRLLALLPGVK